MAALDVWGSLLTETWASVREHRWRRFVWRRVIAPRLFIGVLWLLIVSMFFCLAALPNLLLGQSGQGSMGTSERLARHEALIERNRERQNEVIAATERLTRAVAEVSGRLTRVEIGTEDIVDNTLRLTAIEVKLSSIETRMEGALWLLGIISASLLTTFTVWLVRKWLNGTARSAPRKM